MFFGIVFHWVKEDIDIEQKKQRNLWSWIWIGEINISSSFNKSIYLLVIYHLSVHLLKRAKSNDTLIQMNILNT